MAPVPQNFWDLKTIAQTVTYFVGYLVITIPIEGSFVRWRAHYNPKVVQLEGGDGPDANRKRVNNVFQMLGKVYRVEGVAGLYKGIVPSLISMAAWTIIMVLGAVTHIDYQDIVRYRSHFVGNPFLYYSYEILTRTLRVLLIVLPSLPFSILYIRAVTTPSILPCDKPLRSLRLLFTPTELRRPWVLYTPALILSQALPLGFVFEVLQRLQKLLPPLDNNHTEYVWWRVLLTVLALTVAFVAMPAFEVIKTKLSVQRNFEHSLLPTEERESGVAEYPEVVGFRQESYTGLIDCAKKIVEEEGLKTLFRLWWVNAIVVVVVSGLGRFAVISIWN